ncbi:periplasmic binding protein-like II [Anaeromyces robustus]|uniref:Periplasmic binding protein-like II n=1 Tax=Anaeromyces robustus TaxID=1754192 RepID=A0A1Y1VVK1_9FUNG|nr:periplasmic binding protein-like II [Anaeromyces robustus]|eukprot:ORX65318.1 periplasmic binding protein-like II [Anaeromyces robustus]
MMSIINHYFILITLFLKYAFGETLLNVFAYSEYENNQAYTPFIQGFNEYSNKNNLNITLKLNLLTKKNSTISYNDFGSLIEVLLKKKTQKYDLYLYDNLYTPVYGQYLLDVKNLLPQEHINMFNPKLLNQTCYYNDELVGLPLTLTYSVFYSNQKLLNKYNKPVPKTWDEVIETGQYILEKEKQQNNTDLIIYNGLFDESQNGFSSIYEFIYSCRDSVNSSFPELTSETAVNALKKMKELKEKIASDDIFSLGEDYFVSKFYDGKAIFLKYWIFYKDLLDMSDYKMSILPGLVKGISGSVVAGFNFGIGRNIKKENINGAIEALRYLSSKEGQREFVRIGQIISGIEEFYDDEELCVDIDCDLMKILQPIPRPSSVKKNFEEYSGKYMKYIYNYLYGNDKPEDVLQRVDDLTKIYYISLSTKDSSVGLIIFIINLTLSILFLLSLFILYIKKYEPYFEFLSKPFWLILIIGIIMLLNTGTTKIGKVTNLSCHLYPTLLSFGFTFSIIPIFYKLIISFHDKNKVILWIEQRKYSFFSFFVIIDIILLSIFMIIPYEIQTVSRENEKNYEKCNMNNTFGILYVDFILFYKFFIIFLMLLLIFMEWSIDEIKYDLRFTVGCLYVDTLTIIFLLILHYISIKNYIYYSLIRVSIIILLSIMNYILLFIIRLLFPYFIKADENILEGKIFMNDTNMSSNCIQSIKSEETHKTNITNRSSSVLTKMVSYHYKRTSEAPDPFSEMPSYKSEKETIRTSLSSNKL